MGADLAVHVLMPWKGMASEAWLTEGVLRKRDIRSCQPRAPEARRRKATCGLAPRGGVKHIPARKSRRTDVLIIGSGAVGVAAGLEVHEAGIQVVVLEKEAHLGGAATISGGGCSCVGTWRQREHSIEDSPDLAFNDWITWGEGAADEEWARFYIEHSKRSWPYGAWGWCWPAPVR
jgi:NADPH-dependent 2,4-dienoyl-CoA reductase/sulfur reductase-like enzyme